MDAGQILAIIAIVLAFIIWLTVVIRSNSMLGPVNIVWVGYMTMLFVLIFWVIYSETN